MTRALLEACRHRIANDDMALGREPSPVLAKIDAALAGPRAEGVRTADEWSCDEVMSAKGRYEADIWGKDGAVIATVYDKSATDMLLAAPNMLAALEPFAIWACDSDPDDPDDLKVDDLGVCDITLGHCRGARAAYRKAKGGGA